MTVPLSQLLAGLQDAAEKATPGPWELVEAVPERGLRAFVRRVVFDVPRAEDAAFIAAASPEVVHALAEVAAMSEKHECYIHAGDNMKHGDYDCQLCAALARLWETLRKEDGDE